MNINKVNVRIIKKDEEGRFEKLMDQYHYYHYLGSLPKIGETL